MTGIDRLKGMPPSPIGRLYRTSAGLKDVLNLAPGEPDFDTPPHILAALKKALDEGETHYGPSSGLPELRRAIASHYKEYFEVEVDEKQVLVTHGSTQAIFLALNNLLNPGEEVIIFTPAWFGYKPMIEYSQGVTVEVPLTRNDWNIDYDKLEMSVSPKSKLMIVCSPNNPTGSLVKSKDLEKIVAVASEHKLMVISDEIYNRIVYEKGSFRSIGIFDEIKDQLIIVNGFSKAYAMTGIRLGYLIAPEEIVKHLDRIQGLSNVCISPAIQKAGLAAVTGPQDSVETMMAEYDKRRRGLVRELNSIKGLSCELPAGAFYAFLRVASAAESSEEFSDTLLREQHVLTVPGTAFGTGGEEYVRISYATSHEILRRAMDRMRRMLEGIT